MKTPKNEIEKAKKLLENYKERANDENFTNWEDFKKTFTPEQKEEIEKETQKLLAKIDKKNSKLVRKSSKENLERYVKA